jgi:hypothetical protein
MSVIPFRFVDPAVRAYWASAREVSRRELCRELGGKWVMLPWDDRNNGNNDNGNKEKNGRGSHFHRGLHLRRQAPLVTQALDFPISAGPHGSDIMRKKEGDT